MALRFDLTDPDIARVLCKLTGAESLRVDDIDRGHRRRFRFEFPEDNEVTWFQVDRGEDWRPHVEALIEARRLRRLRRDLAELWATTGWGV